MWRVVWSRRFRVCSSCCVKLGGDSSLRINGLNGVRFLQSLPFESDTSGVVPLVVAAYSSRVSCSTAVPERAKLRSRRRSRNSRRAKAPERRAPTTGVLELSFCRLAASKESGGSSSSPNNGTSSPNGGSLQGSGEGGGGRLEIVKQVVVKVADMNEGGSRGACELLKVYGFETTTDDYDCMICYDAKKNVILLPCMHCGVCSRCMKLLRDSSCPLCRAPFYAHVRIEVEEDGGEDEGGSSNGDASGGGGDGRDDDVQFDASGMGADGSDNDANSNGAGGDGDGVAPGNGASGSNIAGGSSSSNAHAGSMQTHAARGVVNRSGIATGRGFNEAAVRRRAFALSLEALQQNELLRESVEREAAGGRGGAVDGGSQETDERRALMRRQACSSEGVSASAASSASSVVSNSDGAQVSSRIDEAAARRAVAMRQAISRNDWTSLAAASIRGGVGSVVGGSSSGGASRVVNYLQNNLPLGLSSAQGPLGRGGNSRANGTGSGDLEMLLLEEGGESGGLPNRAAPAAPRSTLRSRVGGNVCGDLGRSSSNALLDLANDAYVALGGDSSSSRSLSRGRGTRDAPRCIADERDAAPRIAGAGPEGSDGSDGTMERIEQETASARNVDAVLPAATIATPSSLNNATDLAFADANERKRMGEAMRIMQHVERLAQIADDGERSLRAREIAGRRGSLGEAVAAGIDGCAVYNKNTQCAFPITECDAPAAQSPYDEVDWGGSGERSLLCTEDSGSAAAANGRGLREQE